MENFFDKRLKQIVTLTLVLFSLFLLVKTVGVGVDISRKANKPSYKSLVPRTIAFQGSASVSAVPDVGEFVVSVHEEAENVKDAQQKMTDKVNKAIELLAIVGIDKKDIKTTNYRTNPKRSFIPSSCKDGVCKPRKRVIVGYEARESISIKLRDLTKSGDVLTQIAFLDIAEVRGPIFTVSDESKFKMQAQAAAIKDAKANALVTAKNLGVTLVGMVSFSESPIYENNYSARSLGRVEASSAKIEAGEKRVKSSVIITYEIK